MTGKGASAPKLAGWTVEGLVGEGASGVVWRARRDEDGEVAAVKVGRRIEDEAAILARLGRRYGPRLLDRGHTEGGEPFIALSLVVERPKTPANLLEVAHGVARGLDELHASGVRHGDVKPANIVGTTLIDLDLATSTASTAIEGGTPRYLAPEIRMGQAATPAADLYALGLVLAEIAFPELVKEPTLDHDLVCQRIARCVSASTDASTKEHATLIGALLAKNAGGRPSAAWVAAYAARSLGLTVNDEDVVEDRRARIRRSYLGLRAHEIANAKEVAPSIGEPVRGWLERAIWTGEKTISAPLDAFGIARWIVSLVGPAAASWSIQVDEATLAKRLLDLAKVAPPEAWTYEEVASGSKPGADHRLASIAIPESANDASGWIGVTRLLLMRNPDPRVMDDVEAGLDRAPPEIRTALAEALLRRGDVGRAFAVVGPEKTTLRAELLRRRGELDAATEVARAAGARALLARIAWDRGDVALAMKELGEEQGAAAAEARALIAYSQSDPERGLSALEGIEADSDLGLARIEGTRGMLEHARGRPRESLAAFSRAVELATRAGAVVEEATYLTGLAAAGVDAGIVGPALLSASRGALLWGRLNRPNLAARAHLSRAAAYALIGATHEADLAAEETRRSALAANDARAAAFARWASVETRLPGDPRARTEALLADEELRSATASDEDRIRSAARVFIWGGGAAASLDVMAADERVRALSGTARWEWWGARAYSILTRAASGPSQRVLAEIVALLDVPAPIGSKGPALLAAVRLAREIGDGEVARRIEGARRALATTLREGTPPAHHAALSGVPWLEVVEGETASLRGSNGASVALASAQVGELEAIVRALSSRDRLKPLLAQVLDTMVLWTGVERGLLLLRAPGEAGALVPRAARNLARQDLREEQLALSMGLARRAMVEREAICATDAYAQVGDLHASVHALGLRSVLAVPLIARGDVLGVVYLDDRVRRGAFGPSELAWVRLVASQAALAIADARDQALLRRAVRRAERANARLAAELGAREAELANVRAELASAVETRFRYDEIAGRSEPMRAMLKLVDRVTASEVPVLLAGESGTGKELVARAIHKNGPRGSKSFVSENCGSVPETLLESTLFGHVRGAFTGASATRAGLFDVADGGTLFLDEIGEMPLAMQTKLLRVLQNGEVRPVGGERSHVVNVRIIGATHRDLEAMVAKGTFREDLFYRLNVVSIRVPPLRERREDIPLLVSRFVEKYSADNKSDKRIKVTRAAMDRLATFPWPGNVRQLENEVRRALVLADDRVDVGELSEEVSRGGPSATRDAGLGLKARVDALEAELVRDALQKTQGNQTRAAEVLGISRFGLQKMMRRLGIKAQTP